MRCEKSLGGGFFGSVLQYGDAETGNQVAVKIPREQKWLTLERTGCAHVKRVGSLFPHHPGVKSLVQCLDIGDKVPAVAMPMVKGQDLAEFKAAHWGQLQEKGKRTVEIRSVMWQVLQACHLLSLASLKHGDIKPANIIYDKEAKNAVIVDLGSIGTFDREIASAEMWFPAWAPFHARGLPLGIPWPATSPVAIWMPPEHKWKFTSAYDLFSIGQMFCHLLDDFTYPATGFASRSMEDLDAHLKTENIRSANSQDISLMRRLTLWKDEAAAPAMIDFDHYICRAMGQTSGSLEGAKDIQSENRDIIDASISCEWGDRLIVATTWTRAGKDEIIDFGDMHLFVVSDGDPTTQVQADTKLGMRIFEAIDDMDMFYPMLVDGQQIASLRVNLKKNTFTVVELVAATFSDPDPVDDSDGFFFIAYPGRVKIMTVSCSLR